MKIDIKFSAVVFACFFIVFDTTGTALPVMAAALLHEAGHLAAMYLLKIKPTAITIYPFGADIAVGQAISSYRDDIIIAATGGAVNIFLAAVTFTFMPVFSGCCALFAAMNLMPIKSLDGGRIFRSFLQVFTDRRRATFVAMVVGRVIAVLLAAWGVWEIVHTGRWGWVTVLIAWMIWREGYREYQMALMEERFYDHFSDYTARVSPPPYGRHDDDDEVDIHRN